MLRNVSCFLPNFAAVGIHEDIGDLEKLLVIDSISDFLTSPWEILVPVVHDELDWTLYMITIFCILNKILEINT